MKMFFIKIIFMYSLWFKIQIICSHYSHVRSCRSMIYQLDPHVNLYRANKKITIRFFWNPLCKHALWPTGVKFGNLTLLVIPASHHVLLLNQLSPNLKGTWTTTLSSFQSNFSLFNPTGGLCFTNKTITS